MKCPRCGLNNLELMEVCIKCKFSLVNIVEEKVQQLVKFSPPRATNYNWIKKLYWAIKRQKYFDGNYARILRKSQRTSSFQNNIMFKNVYLSYNIGDLFMKSPIIITNLLIPGLGHFLSKQKKMGSILCLITAVTIITLFIAMTLYSYLVTVIFLNILIMIQIFSTYNIFTKFQATDDSLWIAGAERIIANLLLILGISFCCIYLTYNYSYHFFSNISGTYFANNRVLHNILINMNKFKNGDRVVFVPKSEYMRHDLVLYQGNLPIRGMQHGNNMSSIEYKKNDNFDRIIGLPNEKVTIKKGIIYINNIKLSSQDETTIVNSKIADCEVTLKNNEYFIYPSYLENIFFREAVNDEGLYLVSKNQIIGKAFKIIAPSNRIKVLNKF